MLVCKVVPCAKHAFILLPSLCRTEVTQHIDSLNHTLALTERAGFILQVRACCLVGSSTMSSPWLKWYIAALAAPWLRLYTCTRYASYCCLHAHYQLGHVQIAHSLLHDPGWQHCLIFLHHKCIATMHLHYHMCVLVLVASHDSCNECSTSGGLLVRIYQNTKSFKMLQSAADLYMLSAGGCMDVPISIL